MTKTSGRAVLGVGLVGVLMAAAAGCSSAGDLSFVNNGPDDVTVSTGDDESEVSAGGGVVFLDYGCTPGDIAVTFPSGQVTVVAGPVCPDEEIVIGDRRVDVRPAR